MHLSALTSWKEVRLKSKGTSLYWPYVIDMYTYTEVGQLIKANLYSETSKANCLQESPHMSPASWEGKQMRATAFPKSLLVSLSKLRRQRGAWQGGSFFWGLQNFASHRILHPDQCVPLPNANALDLTFYVWFFFNIWRVSWPNPNMSARCISSCSSQTTLACSAGVWNQLEISYL